MRTWAGMAFCVAMYGALWCGAAQAQTPARDPKQQIAEIYQQAQQLQSPEQCGRALQACQQVDRRQLVPHHAQYLDQLQSWIHNKRGELLVEQAAEAIESGREDAAAALDEQALADFQRAVELNPDSWRALHNRGVSLATRGDLAHAVEDFSAAITLQPDYKNAWFNRAEIYYQLGEYELAEADYSQVLQLDPRDAGAYAGRAHVRYELQDFENALADHHECVRLNPRDAQAYVDRADLLARMGQWKDAAQDYREAIRLDNQLARAYQNAAWVMATCPDERFRNPELAVKAAQRAVELMGEPDYRALDTLAAALASSGRFDEAEQTMQRALAIAPEDAAADLHVRLASYQQERPYQQPAQR